MFPNSFPAQNTHRLVMFHPDIQNPDIERLEDIAANGVKALRLGFDLLSSLPSNVHNRIHKLTKNVRGHLDNRSILTNQFRIDLEECLRALDQMATAAEEDEDLGAVKAELRKAMQASNRVADLIACEHSIGWLREHRDNAAR